MGSLRALHGILSAPRLILFLGPLMEQPRTHTRTLRRNDVNDPLSPSFESLTKLDGIAISCTDNTTLGTSQSMNFGPRLGIAYRVLPKLAVRTGFGMFYGAMGTIGYGPNIGGNYPFLFSFSYFAPDNAHPITYPNGSTGTLETGLSGKSNLVLR